MVVELESYEWPAKNISLADSPRKHRKGGEYSDVTQFELGLSKLHK